AAREKRAGWLEGPLRQLHPLDPARAAAETADLAREAAEADCPHLAALLSGKHAARDALAAAFDLSPFLRDKARTTPQILENLFGSTIAERLETVLAAIRALAAETGEPELMRQLRILK